MKLPVLPFVAPMLAKPVSKLPMPNSVEGGVAYEPKWDGFRCILFRDGDSVVVTSRDQKDLTYCFPEVEAFAIAYLPERVVIDGELIIERDERLDFEALGNRIRPRSEAGRSSIAALAESTPTQLVAFDLLALDEHSFLDEPFSIRRATLCDALARVDAPVHLTPLTHDVDVARDWFERFEGAGLDGLIVKPLSDVYTPGVRSMLKFKHVRTADVVVAGWREHKNPAPDGSPVLGSLLLGVHDDQGRLHHLGVASSFTAAKRVELAALLRAREIDPDDAHPWRDAPDGTRVPGGTSRWTGDRDLTYRAVRPELVAEVKFDQLQGDRFRHTAQFVRWRPDRQAQSCDFEQFERPEPYPLSNVFTA